jgi:copper chaperone NosL
MNKKSDVMNVLKRIDSFFRTPAGVKILMAAGSLLLIASFYLPYWQLVLHAPQYPQGLRVSIYMDHVTGDVSEVNLLNHYIGMGPIDKSATVERAYAWKALLLLSLGALIVLPFSRRTFKVFYLPPVMFLVGFAVDLFYWLYRAGHVLNPDAPVHVKPFTPMLFGQGQIGQFTTLSWFSMGFWVALLATVLFFIAIRRHEKIQSERHQHKSFTKAWI